MWHTAYRALCLGQVAAEQDNCLRSRQRRHQCVYVFVFVAVGFVWVRVWRGSGCGCGWGVFVCRVCVVCVYVCCVSVALVDALEEVHSSHTALEVLSSHTASNNALVRLLYGSFKACLRLF